MTHCKIGHLHDLGARWAGNSLGQKNSVKSLTRQIFDKQLWNWKLIRLASNAFLVLFYCFCKLPVAWASGELSLVGGLNTTSVRASGPDEPAYNAGKSWEAGILDEISLGASRFRLDAGIIYGHRKFTVSESSQNLTLTETASILEFPLLIRIQIFSRFSLAAGLYGAEGLGGFSQTASSASSQKLTYSTAGVRPFDYGLMASARVSVIRMNTSNIFLDARYYNSLGNLAESGINSPYSFKYSGLEILFGIHFGSAKYSSTPLWRTYY